MWMASCKLFKYVIHADINVLWRWRRGKAVSLLLPIVDLRADFIHLRQLKDCSAEQEVTGSVQIMSSRTLMWENMAEACGKDKKGDIGKEALPCSSSWCFNVMCQHWSSLWRLLQWERLPSYFSTNWKIFGEKSSTYQDRWTEDQPLGPQSMYNTIIAYSESPYAATFKCVISFLFTSVFSTTINSGIILLQHQRPTDTATLLLSNHYRSITWRCPWASL